MVNPAEAINLALASLRAHKLRSVLTLLGLIIAVTSLILVMTLVQGANTYVQDKIANLGTNVFEVSKVPLVTTNFDELVEALKNKDITREQWQTVARGCRSCRAVGAVVSTGGQVRSPNQSLLDIQIRGESADMATISTLDLDLGRWFTEAEDRQAMHAALLGYGVREELYPQLDPLRQTVRIGGEEFQVIGVAEEIGSVLGQEQDNFVIIPLTTFGKIYGRRNSLTLKVQASSEAALPLSMEEVRTLLRRERRLAYSDADDFYLATADTYLSLWEDISSVFFAVFVLVSAIASIVGGIVIMNIMLVSVSERTKEIGLRRSVGATRQDILRHFLLEALAICVFGGLIGETLGFGVALLLREFTPFPATVRIWVAMAGLVLSSAIALIFGIYPAMKAARLDPAVALRAE